MKQAATSYSLVMTQGPPHSAEGRRPTIPLKTAGRGQRLQVTQFYKGPRNWGLQAWSHQETANLTIVSIS